MRLLNLVVIIVLLLSTLFIIGCISPEIKKTETIQNKTIEKPPDKTENNWKPETGNQTSLPQPNKPPSPELEACIAQAIGEDSAYAIFIQKREPTITEGIAIDNCFKQFGEPAFNNGDKTKGAGSETENNNHGPISGQYYGTYPDTVEAPVLEFLWDPPDLDVNTITRLTPYGVWENWIEYPEGIAYEPAVEMQFYTTTFHDPVYAVAAGVVVDATNGEDGNAGMVIVSYGKNYGVTYHHVVNILANITPGTKIEKGTPIAYTEKRMHPEKGIYEGWWEIELNVKRGEVFRSLPPIGYFSEKSQAKLQAILDASPEWSVKGSPKTWSVMQGCTWTKYVSNSEWWTSSTRVGYFYEENKTESEKDFISAINPSWKLKEQGRVIGPKDECK